MLGCLYLQGYYYQEEVLPQNTAPHPDVGLPASELGHQCLWVKPRLWCFMMAAHAANQGSFKPPIAPQTLTQTLCQKFIHSSDS